MGETEISPANDILGRELTRAIASELPDKALEIGKTTYEAGKRMFEHADTTPSSPAFQLNTEQKTIVPMLLQLSAIQAFADLPDEQKLDDSIGGKITVLLIRGFMGSSLDPESSAMDRYLFFRGATYESYFA